MTSSDPDKMRIAANGIIHDHFGSDHCPLQLLGGGFFSSAFGVGVAGSEYVIRLNDEAHAEESFAKDDYAGQHYGSLELPIPKIVARGQTDDIYYAISERAAGRMLGELSPDQRRAVLPDLLDKLEAIGRVDLRGSRGYGDWGPDGNGKADSWRGYLATINENHGEGYYEDWHALYRNSFLERDVYEAVYRHMLALAGRCPEERALIHNDFQFENVISDGERITAVIDWANALYGDHLYDVAWLSWQSTHPGWWYDDGEAFLRERFGTAPDFETRVSCYSCHIGLDHLRFYAKNDRREDYDLCRDWLLRIVEEDS